LKRSELDGLAEFYSLDDRQVEKLLDLAGARPSRAEELRFAGDVSGFVDGGGHL